MCSRFYTPTRPPCHRALRRAWARYTAARARYQSRLTFAYRWGLTGLLRPYLARLWRDVRRRSAEFSVLAGDRKTVFIKLEQA